MDVCSNEFGERTKTGALYDGYYSILVNLHIPKEARVAMFQNIGRALKDSGALCIEDYVLRSSKMQMTILEIICFFLCVCFVLFCIFVFLHFLIGLWRDRCFGIYVFLYPQVK